MGYFLGGRPEGARSGCTYATISLFSSFLDLDLLNLAHIFVAAYILVTYSIPTGIPFLKQLLGCTNGLGYYIGLG